MAPMTREGFKNNKTRTTKVEHKAPGMCCQEYVWSRICVDRPTYRQRETSEDEIQGLLILADIFCFQLYVKIPLFKPF